MFANTQTLTPTFYTVLKSMEESQFEFFLTGSRYFGGIHEGSDYDFFVNENSGVEEWLLQHEFKLDLDSMYNGDPTFVKVYSLNLNEGSIQVQLIKHDQFAKKQIVQRLLYNRYKGHGLPGDKYSKRELWNLAYSIVDTMKIRE